MIPGNNEDEKDKEDTRGEEKCRGHNTILIWSFVADHDGGGPRWSATEPEDDRRPALLEANHARATAYATVGPRPRTRMDASRPSSHSTARGGWPKGYQDISRDGQGAKGEGRRRFPVLNYS